MLLSKKPRLEETNGLQLEKNELITDSTTDSTSLSSTIKNKPSSFNSSLFSPFRTIGVVTNGIPFQLQKLGNHHFVTTSIGNAFHVYSVQKLNLVTVSEPTPAPITALAVFKEYTFVGCGCEAWVYKRATKLQALPTFRQEGHFIQLMVFGEYLIGLNEANFLVVWLYGAQEIYTTFEFQAHSFNATFFLHPHTYLNKLLIGSSQGELQLWNIKTHQLIYSFASFHSPITYLTQSPVIDIIGIGLQNGQILLHHLKLDETICTFDQHSKVCSISFRSDENAIMATSNDLGDIAIWDLSKQRLMHQVKHAHRSALNSMAFLVGQPILLTASGENSLKQYVFDAPESVPRLLKSRSGHTQPPTLLRFYDEEGRYLLSTSKDRALRCICIERDVDHIEFSQGAIVKKSQKWNVAQDTLRLSPIVQLAFNSLQQRDWDSILTCHSEDVKAHTWSFETKSLGTKLKDKPLTCTDEGQITSVTISPCGHYGVLGSSKGGINVYNLQSGILRHTLNAHTNAVTGLFVTRMNHLVSISLDKSLNVWHFPTSTLLSTIPFSSPLTLLTGHLETEFVAFVSDDLSIRILDLTSMKLVREFWGHAHNITDLCFSPDARWVLSTSLDGTLRTWDLPSGNLIDRKRFQKAPLSVAMSPDHSFVATSHVGVVGICLWVNRAQFIQVPLRSLSELEDELEELHHDPSLGSSSSSSSRWSDLPTSCMDTSNATDTMDMTFSMQELSLYSSTYQTPEQLTQEMITLSSQPRSVWMTLFNLDTIRERNKPKENIKVSLQAPFFLPTTSGVVPTFATKKDQNESLNSNSNEPKKETPGEKFLSSSFTQVLQQCYESKDYLPFLSLIESMTPAPLDLELRLLSSDLYSAFLESILYQMQLKRSFELGQTWLHVFLKHHLEPLSRSPHLNSLLSKVLKVQQQEWKRIEHRLQYSQCLLDFIRK